MTNQPRAVFVASLYPAERAARLLAQLLRDHPETPSLVAERSPSSAKGRPSSAATSPSAPTRPLPHGGGRGAGGAGEAATAPDWMARVCARFELPPDASEGRLQSIRAEARAARARALARGALYRGALFARALARRSPLRAHLRGAPFYRVP